MIKKIWPLLCIGILWFVFASPYLLRGKVPFPSTYQVTFFAPWSAYPQFGQPVKNAAMPDVVDQIYPWRYFTVQTWKKGEIPLWNPNSFGGTPHLANYQSAVLSPMNVLFLFLPFIDGWSWLVLLQPLLAGLCIYGFGKKIGLSAYSSLFSAFSWMFCGFLVVWMGYATLGYAILFLPLALFALEGYLQTQKIRFLFLLAATFPLSFFSGHFQISLYFALMVVSYWLFKCIAAPDKKRSIEIGYAMMCGLLVCLPQILPSLEFYSQSLRSTLFVRGEVIPWQYLVTLFSPDFYGNPVTRNDWFGHYAEWNGYIGVLGISLALYSLRKWGNSYVRFFLIAGIGALLLTLPTPIGDILVASHIPVLSTSAASRIIVVFSFCFAILSGFGVEAVMEDIRKRHMKMVIYGIAPAFFLFVGSWAMVVGKIALPLDKVAIAKQNLLLPSGILLCGLVVLGILVFRSGKKMLLFGAICLLLLQGVDVYRFASKWQSFDPQQLVYPRVGVTNEFDSIHGYQRFVGNFGAEDSVYYGLPILEGYDPLYISRMGEFISSLATGKLTEGQKSVVAFPRNGKNTYTAMNLLNVAYVIQKISDTNMPWTFPVWNYPTSQFSLLYTDGVYQVFHNNAVYPRAFFAHSYRVISDKEQILQAIFAPTTNLSQTIILEQDPHIAPSTTPGKARIVRYDSTNVHIQTETPTTQVLFLSDVFYPGWRADIDGKPTTIFRADYAFRAIVVPAGKHLVTFSYLPSSFIAGIIGTIMGISGLFGMWIFLKKKG